LVHLGNYPGGRIMKTAPQLQRPLPRRPFIRTALAAAVGAALLAACQWPGTPVDQLNELRGPTSDFTVALREGTNMATSPSPDGSRIVFSAQGALWVMPAAGGRATRITDWRLEPTAPVWSPDGKRIAFQNYAPEGNYHIWTIGPDGRNPRELSEGPFDDREPAWLPDGSGLVFSSVRSRDGQYKIWRIAAGGGTPGQVTTGPGAESNPVVSPDGAQLAYVDGANVVTAPLAGGAPTVVAPGTAPAWTPPGNALVYQNAARQLDVGGAQVMTDEDIFPFPVRSGDGGGGETGRPGPGARRPAGRPAGGGRRARGDQERARVHAGRHPGAGAYSGPAGGKAAGARGEGDAMPG
jgi:dipeptidyl aminopeptidase/acylaminoacyl peptidase